MSGNGGSGGGELQNTRTLPLVNGGSTVRKKAEAKNLPTPGAMASQEDANLYFLECLNRDSVHVGVAAPDPPYTAGQLWFSTEETELTLFIYDGNDWVPAAPPVSLDGIETSITGLATAVDELRIITTGQGNEIADAKSVQYGFATAIKQLDEGQTRQDNQIIELEEEIESLAPTFDRGEWEFVTEQPAAGQYAIGHLATSEYCLDIVGKCLLEAGDDEFEKSKCNRMAADCESAEEKGEAYLSDSWGGVDTLKIHKLDAKGKEHGFGDWTVGKYVELFNHDDEGYGLFVIDEAAVIEADVATFKVHHVAHEGKPAGVARAKVFEMSSGDPTDFVRKTGDTMTGLLTLKPSEGNALRVYASNEADSRSTLFYIYGKGDEEGNRKNIFSVVADGRVSVSDSFNPTSSNHVTHKKYVDDAISKSLLAPAKYEYKCYINQTGASGTPSAGQAFIFGDTMKARTIQLSLTANNAPVPFQGANGLTMYYHKGDTKQTAMTVTCWYYRSGGPDWKWKGTAEIERVRLYMDYIEITTVADDSRKWANQDIGNAGLYRFTISGLF